MRPVRIITTAAVVIALAVTGCTSRTADQTAAPASSAPSSAPTTSLTTAATTRPTAGSAATTITTRAVPANTSCALSPNTGSAGSRVTLSCHGFAPSEPVDVSFGATVLASAKATTSGQVAASFAVPTDFAGSTIPGRKDTFQAKGRQSRKAASATFTVAITFGAEVLATAKATADGHVVALFAVPSGFAGSHYPGRKDTFLVKGRQ